MAEEDDPIKRLACDRGSIKFSDGISVDFSDCGKINDGAGGRYSILTLLRSGPRTSPDAVVVPNPHGGREVHVRPGLCTVTGDKAHDTTTAKIVDSKESIAPAIFSKYVQVDLACKSDGTAEFIYYTTGDVPAHKSAVPPKPSMAPTPKPP